MSNVTFIISKFYANIENNVSFLSLSGVYLKAV